MHPVRYHYDDVTCGDPSRQGLTQMDKTAPAVARAHLGHVADRSIVAAARESTAVVSAIRSLAD